MSQGDLAQSQVARQDLARASPLLPEPTHYVCLFLTRKVAVIDTTSDLVCPTLGLLFK